ncbi:MAG: zf-TFIIB domain-containing protein [Oscillospiraceae bacterium]|nr:zf-TFIIB domain-containing protein [Oscillospiraceae bacterium]
MGILAFSDELWRYSKYVVKRHLFQHAQDCDLLHNDYHLLVPGEYIAIVLSGYVGNGDDARLANGIYIIAKVISAHKKHFYDDGKAVIEFHDGTTGKIDGSVSGRDAIFNFFVKEQYYNGFSAANNFGRFEVYSFTDRAHLLKCMEMRPKIIAEQKRLEKEIQQRKYEEEARKRRLEEEARRRSASVSDYDLSKAFRGETKASGYDYLHCPKCGTNLRVPLNKGKIEVKCPNCKYTFITTT